MGLEMEKYYIWSNEHQLWWKPQCHGYTENIWEAGQYSKTEAEEIVENANINGVNGCMIPLHCVHGKIHGPPPGVDPAEYWKECMGS